MKSRIFLFFAIVSVAGMLAMSGCHRDDDEQNDRNGRNNSTTGTLSGHDYVDLGLPSGTKWATCNVGANSPEEYGDYFAWGETTTKETYTWETYIYAEGTTVSDLKLTKYNNDARCGNNGFTDNLTTLEASDDAATTNWGSGWRMPTHDEVKELTLGDYCTITTITQNGVNGMLFTSRTNGNSIFLPATGMRRNGDLDLAGTTGYYWSSTLSTVDRAFYLYWLGSDCTYRSDGLTVRPVCNR